MCSSSRQNRQETCRQGRSAVLTAFLSKPSFLPHHQPLFFSLSLTSLPFPPPYFPLQCPFSCCFLFPAGSFPLKLTLPCQSSSWKQHFSCCFHTPLLAPVCHPLVPCPPPLGDLNVSGAGTAWSCVHPVPCATGPLCFFFFFFFFEA